MPVVSLPRLVDGDLPRAASEADSGKSAALAAVDDRSHGGAAPYPCACVTSRGHTQLPLADAEGTTLWTGRKPTSAELRAIQKLPPMRRPLRHGGGVALRVIDCRDGEGLQVVGLPLRCVTAGGSRGGSEPPPGGTGGPPPSGLAAVGSTETLASATPALQPDDPLPPRRAFSAYNGNRSATRVKRLSRSNKFKRMFTLTFPGEGVHDYDESYRLVAGWLHYHGRQWFPGYLMVPEEHPGGHGWHWHLLHRDRPNKKQLAAIRRSWSSYLASHGHDNHGARIHAKHWGSTRKAAEYAAKYVGKALDGIAPGRNRYMRSLGLTLPEVTELVIRSSLSELADYFEALGWKVATFQTPTGYPLLWSGPP